MKTRLAGAMGLVLIALACGSAHAQVPQLVNYQGRVAVGTVNFNGSGAFKFALVNAAGTTTYWSNDGTSAAGSQPTSAVSLTVTKGLYSVLLGDTAIAGMPTAIPATVWANADVRLRVWFNDGTNGSQLLTPDQRLAPNGYLPDNSVGSAAIAANAVTTAKIASGAVTNTQLGAGAVQSANIAAGAVANAQLANSTITVTAGSGLGGGGAVSLGGNVTLTNAGVLSLTGGGGITVNAATGAITLGSNATSANIANAIVLRDVNGSFSAGNITSGEITAAGSITAAGNITAAGGTINLPSTLNPSTGLIIQNGSRLLHTFGTNNFFAGVNAGNLTMTGNNNTGSGLRALTNNTEGSFNTASGVDALVSNTTGTNNTATGVDTLHFNTSGTNNIATGTYAMINNTTAGQNVAIGTGALGSQSFTNGSVQWNSNNVAVGYQALLQNQPTATSNGINNATLGNFALFSNTTGSANTAVGFNALLNNSTGANNIAFGTNAGSLLTTGNNNIDIGHVGVGAEANTIRIGTNGTQTDTYLSGVIHEGVGTGTSQPPDKGLITRRTLSANSSAGQVIARTDKLTLERDGTNSGLRISWVANPGNNTISFTGLTPGNTTVTFVLLVPNPNAPGIATVFADGQGVISFRGSFGDSFTPGHQTEVSVSHYVGHPNWTGTLTSTYNQ